MRRLEAIYVWYGWTVACLLLVGGSGVPHRWLWLAAHALLVVPAYALSRWGSQVVRYAAGSILVLGAFSSLGVLLPDLVPEPFHWRVIEWDHAVGGGWVQSALADPPPWLVELCQVCYSTFYLLPFALGIPLVVKRKWRAVSHVAELVIGGFLLSYLGYLLMPTLPPYRFLSYEKPLEGIWLFPFLNRLLYDAEMLRQDCMPSGHTMITLLLCALAWRYARRQLAWLGPVALFLILGTLVLRYHWFIDLVVALPFAVLAWSLFRVPCADGLLAESGGGLDQSRRRPRT